MWNLFEVNHKDITLTSAGVGLPLLLTLKWYSPTTVVIFLPERHWYVLLPASKSFFKTNNNATWTTPREVALVFSLLLWKSMSSTGVFKIFQTSKMELFTDTFTKIVHVFPPSTISAKKSVLDVWLGSACLSCYLQHVFILLV